MDKLGVLEKRLAQIAPPEPMVIMACADGTRERMTWLDGMIAAIRTPERFISAVGEDGTNVDLIDAYLNCANGKD